MSDPGKKADFLRKTLIKGNKYLIAKVSGQEVGIGARKILDVYFRYKDYLDPIENPDWFLASLEEVWSPKFLGLRENFLNLPVEKVKKLEYQNPSYSAAFRLSGKKGDPRKYAKVFTVQVAGCNFDCNFCYVPLQHRVGNERFGRYFSAREIVEQFLKVKKQRSNEEWNVLRISGGEPLTIVPEIILDIEKEVVKKTPQTYLWIDTNLSTPKYIKEFDDKLRKCLLKRNVGVVGCFKGVDKNDFSILTGVDPKFYENQFETAKILAEWGVDLYLYLPALVYENNIEEKIENFIRRLRKIHENLPLKLEVLSIINYPAAEINIKQKAKQGRPLPKTDQRKFFDLWDQKILSKFYSKQELEKYCCESDIR